MIHSSAIVSPQAALGSGISIGPFCVIGAGVTIGDDCVFDSHVVVEGPTVIGSRNRFYPFCAIGLAPQDVKYHGEETRLSIGSDNTFREYVNIHRGTPGGGGHTVVGDHNFLLVGAHIAHDCIVGSHILMANAATLAGHVTVEDYATVGAYSGIHQFCRVGAHGYVGGYSVVTKDVLPYSKTVSVRDTHAFGVNSIGLERRGFSPERIKAIEAAFRLLLRARLNTTQAIDAIKRDVDSPDVRQLIEFIESSTRGVIK